MKNTLLRTYTGQQLDLSSGIKAEELVLEDIAHSLSLQCRFNGMTDRFYSVAEHCVRAALIFGEEVAKDGTGNLKPRSCMAMLMHDASEAYLTDVPTPVKLLLGAAYYDVERRLMGAVSRKYGFEQQWKSKKFQGILERIDKQLLHSELKTMFTLPEGEEWYKEIEEAPEMMEGKWGIGWSPEVAKAAFIQYYHTAEACFTHEYSVE